MSTETSMELDGEYSSNVSNSTDAIIKGTGTCYSSSVCGLSLISDPNIASLSSSTSSGDDSIFVSGASSSRLKQQSDHHQQEIRIFNVDFRALSTGVAVCNNDNNTCSTKEEEGSCAAGSEPLYDKTILTDFVCVEQKILTGCSPSVPASTSAGVDLIGNSSVETGFFPGILSPAPGNLPPVSPPGFFSQVVDDTFMMMPSPSRSTVFFPPLISSPNALDLFNSYFDF